MFNMTTAKNLSHPFHIFCYSPKVNETWASLSEAIREEASKVYSKIRSLFVLAPGKTFLETFDAEVESFRKAAKNIPVEKLLLLVKDPTIGKS
jgi:hypothetical protein